MVLSGWPLCFCSRVVRFHGYVGREMLSKAEAWVHVPEARASLACLKTNEGHGGGEGVP